LPGIYPEVVIAFWTNIHPGFQLTPIDNLSTFVTFYPQAIGQHFFLNSGNPFFLLKPIHQVSEKFL
jgi:hypothetical protein